MTFCNGPMRATKLTNKGLIDTQVLKCQLYTLRRQLHEQNLQTQVLLGEIAIWEARVLKPLIMKLQSDGASLN